MSRLNEKISAKNIIWDLPFFILGKFCLKLKCCRTFFVMCPAVCSSIAAAHYNILSAAYDSIRSYVCAERRCVGRGDHHVTRPC